jgi:hypothetical protein
MLNTVLIDAHLLLLSRSMCDCRRGLDWWTDLLTTYTHHSELQVIIAPSLISTIHKSPQHPISLFLASYIFTSRSLATASNSGGSSVSRSQVLSSQHPMQISTELCPLLITSRHESRRNTPFPLLQSNCYIIKNLLLSNENVFTEPLPGNGRCLHSHRLATGIYATLWYKEVPWRTKHLLSTCERYLEDDESATYILCDCEAIAYLRFRHLG